MCPARLQAWTPRVHADRQEAVSTCSWRLGEGCRRRRRGGLKKAHLVALQVGSKRLQHGRAADEGVSDRLQRLGRRHVDDRRAAVAGAAAAVRPPAGCCRGVHKLMVALRELQPLLQQARERGAKQLKALQGVPLRVGVEVQRVQHGRPHAGGRLIWLLRLEVARVPVVHHALQTQDGVYGGGVMTSVVAGERRSAAKKRLCATVTWDLESWALPSQSAGHQSIGAEEPAAGRWHRTACRCAGLHGETTAHLAAHDEEGLQAADRRPGELPKLPLCASSSVCRTQAGTHAQTTEQCDL